MLPQRVLLPPRPSTASPPECLTAVKLAKASYRDGGWEDWYGQTGCQAFGIGCQSARLAVLNLLQLATKLSSQCILLCIPTNFAPVTIA